MKMNNYSLLRRSVALLQILLQLFLSSFPFVPSMALSSDKKIAVAHTLQKGETIDSVAEQIGMSRDELWRINHSHHMLKDSFDKLHQGDVVYYKDDTTAAEDNNKNVATYAASVGAALGSGSVKGYGSSALSGIASQSAQDFLSSWGTARLQLNLDDNFHIYDSSADVLIPAYDSGNILAFTQWGFRHKDNRNTGNVGSGIRYFSDTTMYGANAFFDNDFSGENRRWGMGLELWRDYLKFSANGYFRITDWHQSRDLNDYDERPANGFDMRAEAYLPDVPQLGAKLVYEQYYGNEVGLFGSDRREKNPKAITVGVNYTPVPLVTLGVDFRDSQKGGNTDTILGLKLNYEFGVPINKQLDPDAVAFTRSLAGSRKDLVDRNNEIVLEYRKQELIKLTIDKMIRGDSETIVPVHADVTSKYAVPVGGIQWSGDVLSQPGVTINQVGSPASLNGRTEWRLKLPKYIANQANKYTLSARANDTNNNYSSEVDSDVLVNPPSNTFVKDSLSCNPQSIVVNSGVASICEVRVQNAKTGEPASDVEINWKTTLGELSGVQSITDSNGVARINLTSEKSGVAQVNAVMGSVSESTSVKFIDGAVSPDKSSLAVDPKVIKADYIQKAKILFTAKNAEDEPLDNLDVKFTQDGIPVTISDVKSEGQGQYSALLSGQKVGIVNIGVEVAGASAGIHKESVTLVAGDADLTKSTIDANPTVIQADGQSGSLITLKAIDKNDNVVTGAKVVFKTDGVTTTLGAVKENEPGQYQANLTAGTQAGNVVISATINGEAVTNTANVELKTGNVNPDNSKLRVKPDVIKADGKDQSTLIFTAVDGEGNAIKGGTVTFTTGKDEVPVTIGRTGEVSDGVYQATLSGKEAGDVNVSAVFNGAGVGLSAKVSLVPGDVSPEDSSLKATPDTIEANGAAASEIILTAVDGNKNPVTNGSVTFSPEGVPVTLSEVSEVSPGEYHARLVGNKAGVVKISATINNIIVTETAQVTLTVGDISPDSVLEANPDSIIADGKATSTLRLTAVDESGNALTGGNVVFTTDNAVEVNVGTANETSSGSGVYEATLTAGTQSGKVVISATYNGTKVKNTASVTLTSSNTLNMTVTKDNAYYDGSEQNQVQVKITDQNGQPVNNMSVALTVDTATAKLVPDAITTGSDGTALAGITDTVKGNVVVTATTSTGLSNTVTVHFIPRPKSFKSVTIPDWWSDASISYDLPQSGFVGASFILNLKDANASDYKWSVDSDAFSVDEQGKVSILKKAKTAVVQAVNKNDADDVVSYTINIKNWWFTDGENQLAVADAKQWCANQNAIVPASKDLSSNNQAKATSSLYNSWGPLTKYWAGGYYTTTNTQNSKPVIVNAVNGGVYPSDSTESKSLVACKETL